MTSIHVHHRLCAGHAALDERFADILRRVENQPHQHLGAAWAEFARDLSTLMDYEEREIFDDYRRESPEHAATVAALCRDHARLRELLIQLGDEIDRGRLRSQTVAELIACLCAHCQREDATVYPWLHQRRGRARAVGRAPRLHALG